MKKKMITGGVIYELEAWEDVITLEEVNGEDVGVELQLLEKERGMIMIMFASSTCMGNVTE